MLELQWIDMFLWNLGPCVSSVIGALMLLGFPLSGGEPPSSTPN